MAPKRNPGVKSADRTLELLEFVAKALEPPTFADLATGLDIPKSSLFHLLHSLSHRGYLEQVKARGGYRLGPAVVELARHVAISDDVAALIRPLVGGLSRALNETSGFYEPRGDHVELTVASPVLHPLQIDVSPGRMMPLYGASNGRVILAQFSDEELAAYIARTTFEAFTPATLRSAADLRRDIESIRRTGFSESRGEFAVGIMSIAVALRRGGQVLGSIGVILPIARHTEEFGHEARRQLLAAAQRFERTCDEPPPSARA